MDTEAIKNIEIEEDKTNILINMHSITIAYILNELHINVLATMHN